MILGTIDTLKITAIATAVVNERQLVGFDDAPAGADAVVKGVAANAAAIGDAFGLTMIGVVDLVAGAAIAAEDELVSDANGKAVPKGAGVNVFGRALTAAANPGDSFRALVIVR